MKSSEKNGYTVVETSEFFNAESEGESCMRGPGAYGGARKPGIRKMAEYESEHSHLPSRPEE